MASKQRKLQTMKNKTDTTKHTFIHSIGFLAMLTAVLMVAGCGQVDSGETGFFTRWGEITSSEPLNEGLHFYEPVGTDLVTYSIRNQTITTKTPVFTKDVQSMDIELSVTFNLEKAKVIPLHRSTGKNYTQVLIVPSILSAAKDALGKMEAGDIVSNREIATQNIAKMLSEKLTPYGINVTLVNITNIDYSDAFEKAVEEKQVALQKSIKEKNETARLREVAEQNVIKAEAEAKAQLLQAEAEAKAMLVKAEAEAKSIDMRNKALSASTALIQYETVRTWDGKLPVQMFGNAPIPFLELNSVNKETK